MLDLAPTRAPDASSQATRGLLTVTAGGNTASASIQTAGCFAQYRATMALSLQLHFMKNECSGGWGERGASPGARSANR